MQACVYSVCKINLKESEAILHANYSQSHKNKQDDEIQSAYFGQSTFSLFAACVYHLDNEKSLIKRPIVVVSESSDHSRVATLTCLDFVVKAKEKHITLMKKTLWSDCSSAQFRYHFLFKLQAAYRTDLLIDQHQNEVHHGKELMDGIGCMLCSAK